MKVRVPLLSLRAALKAIVAGTLLLPGSGLIAQDCPEQTVIGESRLRLISAARETLHFEWRSCNATLRQTPTNFYSLDTLDYEVQPVSGSTGGVGTGPVGIDMNSNVPGSYSAPLFIADRRTSTLSALPPASTRWNLFDSRIPSRQKLLASGISNSSPTEVLS